MTSNQDEVIFLFIFFHQGKTSSLKCTIDDEVRWETCLSSPVTIMAADQ